MKAAMLHAIALLCIIIRIAIHIFTMYLGVEGWGGIQPEEL